jgi:hypothetical protein
MFRNKLRLRFACPDPGNDGRSLLTAIVHSHPPYIGKRLVHQVFANVNAATAAIPTAVSAG